MTEEERFEHSIEKREGSDMLVTTVGMSAIAIFFANVQIVLLIAFNSKGKKQASDIIKKHKENLMWNGIIVITYVNYIGIVIKARDMIINV